MLSLILRHLVNIVILLITSPFVAAVEMFGVYASVGIQSKFNMLFGFLKHATYVCLCAVISMFLSSIGLQLLIIPGIFLLFALTLTMPLIIEKGLSPINAIITCIRATRFQWFQIFALHMILLMFLLIAFLPLLVLLQSQLAIVGFCFCLFSMSYLGPLYYNMKGILYREIFGLNIQTSNNDTIVNNTFSA